MQEYMAVKNQKDLIDSLSAKEKYKRAKEHALDEDEELPLKRPITA